ncbi:MAG: cupin domain-containing protein [Chitinophagales bacterium]
MKVPEIQFNQWASVNHLGHLVIDITEKEKKMFLLNGTGTHLVGYKSFGADIIRFESNAKVINHTHKGDHILFVLSGSGFVEYNGVEYPLSPGVSYLIPGNVNHAMRSIDCLVLISVSNDYRPLESEERLQAV